MLWSELGMVTVACLNLMIKSMSYHTQKEPFPIVILPAKTLLLQPSNVGPPVVCCVIQQEQAIPFLHSCAVPKKVPCRPLDSTSRNAPVTQWFLRSSRPRTPVTRPIPPAKPSLLVNKSPLIPKPYTLNSLIHLKNPLADQGNSGNRIFFSFSSVMKRCLERNNDVPSDSTTTSW